jgi:hypothetical protein
LVLDGIIKSKTKKRISLKSEEFHPKKDTELWASDWTSTDSKIRIPRIKTLKQINPRNQNITRSQTFGRTLEHIEQSPETH